MSIPANPDIIRTTGANRAGASVPRLFGEDGDQSIPSLPPVVRSRETSAAVAAIGFGSAAVAGSLTLNLFRNTEYVAVLDHVEVVAALGSAWVGTIPDIEGSSVILSLADGVFTASITLPGTIYSVRDLGNGRYSVVQVDPQGIPRPD